jgi:hypothetical protein
MDVPHGDFDANERGVQAGSVVYPWHRVMSCTRSFTQPVVPETAQIKLWIRLHADDGSADGAVYVVPADRFETDALGVTLIVERNVEPETGEAAMERVMIPWGRVLQYERVTNPTEVSARPNGLPGARPET